MARFGIQRGNFTEKFELVGVCFGSIRRIVLGSLVALLPHDRGITEPERKGDFHELSLRARMNEDQWFF